MSKLWTVILAMLRAYFSKPTEEDLQDELNRLEDEIDKKKIAIDAAMFAGDMGRYHKFYGEWVRLCVKANRLRKRIKKD